MGGITQALAGYAREHEVEIITDAPVAELRVDDGRIGAVVLEDGREFRAPVVASNVSAKTVYLDWIEPRHLPDEVLREITGCRTFSTAFKVNIACERPPQYQIARPPPPRRRAR